MGDLTTVPVRKSTGRLLKVEKARRGAGSYDELINVMLDEQDRSSGVSLL